MNVESPFIRDNCKYLHYIRTKICPNWYKNKKILLTHFFRIINATSGKFIHAKNQIELFYSISTTYDVTEVCGNDVPENVLTNKNMNEEN